MRAGAVRAALAGAVTCAMAIGMAAGARVQRPMRAMWVRSQQAALGPRSGDALLDFCRGQRIEVLFVAAPELNPDGRQKWRRFIARAHQGGIRVHALAGEAQWGLVQDAPPNGRAPGPMLGAGRSHALKHVGQVIVYNRGAAPAERFDGVQHDVPVWNTDEYASAESAAARASMLANYVEQLWGCTHFLRALGRVAVETDGEQAEFGTSIPAGLDEPTTWGKQGQYKQAALPASQQVIRTVDYAVIVTGADTCDAILAAASEHVRFAGQMNRRAFVGVSTAPVAAGGASATFGDDGRAAMEKVLAEVAARLRAEPGFAGIAIDSYSTCASLKP